MAQSSLFKENSLVLEEPTRTEWQLMQDKLNSSCNKQLLQQFAETFIPWLGKYGKIYKQRPNGSVVEAKELNEMLKSTTSKYVITEGVALILASSDNLQLYIDSLKPNLRQLWREVLLYGYVEHNKAKKILGLKSNLFNTNYSYYYYSNNFTWNRRELQWFTTSHLRSVEKQDYGYRSYTDFITVSNIIRGIFFPLFFPELKRADDGYETLPDGNWHTMDMEVECLANFKLFMGLFRQGELPLKKKGISASDMKRANKKLAFSEFFPDNHNEYREFIHAFNYMGVLGLNEHSKSAYKAKKMYSYEDTLLDLFKNFDKLDLYLPALLYPHIKGLRINQTQWGHHTMLCKYMMEWLQEHPDNWVAISDIYLKIVELDSNNSNNIYNALVYKPQEEQSTSEIVNLYSNRTIDAASYCTEFGLTGLQSFAFILASLGMVEIAVNLEPESDKLELNVLKKETQTPFDCLHYVRLTPLGRYALGISNEYVAPEHEHEAYFELDPNRLIIRSLVDPNPYAQLLLDTSVHITRNRFETSALSFLTNCHSREDVESKISIFRQFIANELPPLWEEFFQQLLQHCHPLADDKTTYRHYTLQPENRELIHHITTDPVLQQIVIRAEGFRIMVKNEDLKRFETQLKKYGYLL